MQIDTREVNVIRVRVKIFKKEPIYIILIAKLYIKGRFYMKMLNQRINELWQSQDKGMGTKGNLLVALFFAGTATCLIPLHLSSGMIDKILYGYIILTLFDLALIFVATYFYIYSKKKFNNYLEIIIKLLYKFLICISLIVCAPVMLFLNVMEFVLNIRARKIGNYQIWMIILVIDLMLMCILGNVNTIFSAIIATHIELIVPLNINTYAIMLFCLLGLIKVEWEILNNIILRIMNRYGIAKIKKETLKKEIRVSNNLPSNLDIKKYSEEKKQIIDNFEKNKSKELEYDIAYQKTTLWRFQLSCLIFLFFIAAFTDGNFFESQSDAVNVITAFTLIMLYSDKRRTWDKDMLGL